MVREFIRSNFQYPDLGSFDCNYGETETDAITNAAFSILTSDRLTATMYSCRVRSRLHSSFSILTSDRLTATACRARPQTPPRCFQYPDLGSFDCNTF